MTTLTRNTLLLLFNLLALSLGAQNPPEEFFKGLDLVNKNNAAAKKEFIAALQKDSTYHGTHHFLGVIWLEEGKNDSAVMFFKNAIRLNTENQNHTREMSWSRLISAYLLMHEFEKSFNAGWEALQLFPENSSIKAGLKNVCLWAFHIRHHGLDSSYLSTEMKDEYIVNSIAQEYMILRILRVDGKSLTMKQQSLITKGEHYYDNLSCTVGEDGRELDLMFRLNWDLGTEFGGKTVDSDAVYKNKSLPVYERIGALLVKNEDSDLIKEISKLIN